ncbi:hypothetical protein [Streptomyces sp. NPDC018972]|uniref:hypothetical protein n=1 Tax=Streptomyces sp. NPDC018972 TaxID=3365060 RepID=UPI0037902EFA
MPKPGPPRPVQQCFQERPSPFPWEQDALDHVRRLMPSVEPYRAWATFSFTARSGRINERDLLIAVPAGLSRLAESTLARRLADLESATQVLPEQVRFVMRPG